MSGLKVGIYEMENALEEIGAAAEHFKDISDSAFDADLERLDAMNSDFVDKYYRLLECVKKWKVAELLSNMNTFRTDADTILTDIVETDEAHNGNRLAG